MVKIKRTYSLEQQTVEAIERLARSTRRDLSAVIDIAIEEYERTQPNLLVDTREPYDAKRNANIPEATEAETLLT
jgi:hypothetical protein